MFEPHHNLEDEEPVRIFAFVDCAQVKPIFDTWTRQRMVKKKLQIIAQSEEVKKVKDGNLTAAMKASRSAKERQITFLTRKNKENNQINYIDLKIEPERDHVFVHYKN